MSDPQSGIRALSPAKGTRERCLREKAVRPRSMTRTAPLSFAQQRLWFLAQLEPRSPAYNILSATQIEGPLDTAALERSLIEMSRRHETLRTTFAAEDATPVQLIHPSTELKLQQLDFTA